MKFLLYGAYGYTGELITRMANKYGLNPVLAGRNPQKLEQLANEHGYEFLVFALDEKEKLEAALKDVKVVLHAAGPFKFTARPMMEACIRKGVHYLDITGEIEVFEMAHAMDQEAQKAGIMLMSGVGFDVVPTDCMAAYLKQQLPDATHLQLAFASRGGNISHGTSMTMVENLGEKGAMRKDGKITPVPLGHIGREVPFFPKNYYCMAIPWGDVSTAYYTTQIPNIETLTRIDPRVHKMMRFQWAFNWLLKLPFVKKLARKEVKNRPAGPTEKERKNSTSHVWGKVWNAQGEERQAKWMGPETYTLTAITSMIILKRVLKGNWKSGHQTPAGLYGPDLIMELEGTKREDIS